MRPRAPIAALLQGPSHAIASAIEIATLVFQAEELSSDDLDDDDDDEDCPPTPPPISARTSS